MMNNCGAVLAFEQILDLAAAGVVEGIARDLGNRGRDAGLILRVEAEQPGDLAGALARGDRIVLVADADREDGDNGSCLYAAFATTTVASSLPRVKSRYSTPAIRAGIAQRQAGIVFQTGAGGEPVGVHHQHAVVGPRITELPDPLGSGGRRCR